VARCFDGLEIDRIVSMGPAGARPSPRLRSSAQRDPHGEVDRIALAAEGRQCLNETDESQLRRVIDIRMPRSQNCSNCPHDSRTHEVEQGSRRNDVTGGRSPRKFERRVANGKARSVPRR
jgi:hypothetical protein